MSLLPESKAADRITGSSLLDEELASLHNRGIELHTVWHKIPPGWASRVIQVHKFPRIRNPVCSTRALHRWFRHRNCTSLCAPSALQRFELARVQMVIADVVARKRLDLIHSHWARPSATAGVLAKKLADVPLVITLRGADVLTEPSIGYGQTLNPWATRRISHALETADRVMCVSQRILERALELGASPDRTEVVPKGVHHELFVSGSRRQARAELELADRPTILFVGALGPWKGLTDLLDAFALLRRGRQDVQLVVCGRGPLESQIRSYVRDHDLADDVRLDGYIERADLPRYFQACDVFVLPSLTEGSGNVLLEAAACGRPSVGTRVGGIPDYIVDGETGLLANKRDPADIADKLKTILQNESLAEEMGAAGRQRVEADFRYEQMIDRILHVYDDVLR